LKKSQFNEEQIVFALRQTVLCTPSPEYVATSAGRMLTSYCLIPGLISQHQPDYSHVFVSGRSVHLLNLRRSFNCLTY